MDIVLKKDILSSIGILNIERIIEKIDKNSGMKIAYRTNFLAVLLRSFKPIKLMLKKTKQNEVASDILPGSSSVKVSVTKKLPVLKL